MYFDLDLTELYSQGWIDKAAAWGADNDLCPLLLTWFNFNPIKDK